MTQRSNPFMGNDRAQEIRYESSRMKRAAEKAILTKLKATTGKNFEKAHWVVAVSGGPDSMALGQILASHFSRHQMTIAHFNHHVRPVTAQRDENLVVEHFSNHNIVVRVGKGSGKYTSEAAMRDARLEFLRSIALEKTDTYIVTAHHLDDQIETLLMRFIRGTGLSGLASMKPQRGKFIKPCLDIPREALERYCLRTRTPFFRDETNESSRYFRNRVRHNLILKLLELAGEFGGKIPFYCRTKQLFGELRANQRYLNRTAKSFLSQQSQVTPYWLKISIESLLNLDPYIRTHCLRSLVQQLGLRPLSRRSTWQLSHFLKSRKRTLQLEQSLVVEQSLGFLYFQNTDMKRTYHQFLSLDSEGRLAALSIEKEKVPQEVEVRFFQPGDKFNRRKLKKVLLEGRVPRLERPLIPFVCRRNSPTVLYSHPNPFFMTPNT